MNKQLVFSKLKTIFSVFICFASLLVFSWLAAWETYLGYLGLLILFFGIVFWKIKGKDKNFILITESNE